MKEGYHMCTRCIMDTTDPDIEFGASGTCNHCRNYEKLVAERLLSGKERKGRLSEIVSDIKQADVRPTSHVPWPW